MYIRKTLEQMKNDSYERALTENLMVDKITNEQYIVNNIDNNTEYTIMVENDYVTSCECPHHTYRNVCCKHIWAVALEYDLNVI